MTETILTGKVVRLASPFLTMCMLSNVESSSYFLQVAGGVDT